ncbi:zinc finger protein GAI-ASSOCIATED FACTOR 1-like [Vigna unguiculata]|uniref:Regulatory protein SWI5 n=1 Tax=Vigna unguiculata TaxID=3917 RepID=A0A4D6N322_VIGUN|nr:zinc finger protein GAI-ASSOCIATED FACTOR 1-like [Vigna unguiculata]QCE07332.1 regulatory protein SWI5 [Vigna unguiculata]
MSNITSCDSGSFSTENTREDAAAVKHQPEMLPQFHSPHSLTSTTTTTNNTNASNTISQPPPPVKKKRSLPGNPDPSAEVIALSPNTLMATNRFICEICNKGFQRDQNLQLHRRGHNLPWKLKQRTSTEVRKRVYVCPEPSCVHHNPARALGDLTGIKKHFCRKHGEKKWKCDKCSKKYAVQSDWKAHSKICGTREYKCDCGTIFSRRDSFITHRAFCDALAEENNKANEGQIPKIGSNLQCQQIPNLVSSLPINTNVVPNPQQIGGTSEFNRGEQKHPLSLPHELMPMPAPKPFNNNTAMAGTVFSRSLSSTSSPSLQLSSNIFEENGPHLAAGSPHMSATALLQKAAQMGATVTEKSFSTNMAPPSFGVLQQQQPNGQSFMNQYMHSGQHQQDPNVNISAQYNGFGGNGMSGGSVGMNGVDMFNAILDQSKALSKIIEQSNRSSSGGATNGGSSAAINVAGSKGSEDVMTLDFLGIGGGGGGGGAQGNFYGSAQQAENGAADEVWRNWSSKNAGFESFSATSSI